MDLSGYRAAAISVSVDPRELDVSGIEGDAGMCGEGTESDGSFGFILWLNCISQDLKSTWAHYPVKNTGL